MDDYPYSESRDPQWNWNNTDATLRWWELPIDDSVVLEIDGNG